MHILFLSANDFKEKSIQVLRKTPEAYAAKGHKVSYIVLRDYSKAGNYYYEKEINPEGIRTIRLAMPLNGLRNSLAHTAFLTIATQLSAYFGVLRLFKYAKRLLKNETVDIIYGYETQGVNAVSLLRLFKKTGNAKIVSRFQGSWISKYLKEKNRLKLLLNYDDILALKSYADLCIMTNDGTEGDYAMEQLRSKALPQLRFWVNGVDKTDVPKKNLQALQEKFNPQGKKMVFCSVSRLEPWKRVDRILYVLSLLVREHSYTDFTYLILGEGSEKQTYEKLSKKLGISDYVQFIGAVEHKKVQEFLCLADVFFSTYDLSNVGNPLLEAIRAHQIIFTLNNGTTSDWIQHKKNGFIYSPNKEFPHMMAKDLHQICIDEAFRDNILLAIKKSEEKLWTWDERLNREVTDVTALVKT